MVEGSWCEGDTCLIIEDTVTSGSSILETAEVLHKEGLKVNNHWRLEHCNMKLFQINSSKRSDVYRMSLFHMFKVTDAIVLMDREQGGMEMLASLGIRLLPIISMFKLLDVLLAAERIDAPTAQSVRKFILDNNTFRYWKRLFFFLVSAGWLSELRKSYLWALKKHKHTYFSGSQFMLNSCFFSFWDMCWQHQISSVICCSDFIALMHCFW